MKTLLLAALILALAGGVAQAKAERTERGDTKVNAGSKDGKPGFAVSYHLYTYRDFTGELNALMSYSGRATRIDGRPGGNTPAAKYDNKTVEFDHPIDIGVLDRVLGRPSWVSAYGNKKTWIKENFHKTPTGFKTTDKGNTASSLVEATRLARIYELLELGVEPTAHTLSGWHSAFYQDHGYTISFTKAAVLAKLREVFAFGIDTYSPIVLDLNHDGRIGVTGRSTAAVRNAKNGFVAAGSVSFDLRGAGKEQQVEWTDNSGDGFLVYDKDGAVTQTVAKGGRIDGLALFGNAIGYEHGFQKLARNTFDIRVASAEGAVPPAERTAARGDALRDLKVWIDRNGDARIQDGELLTLGALGIIEIGLVPRFEKNKDGETVILGEFVQAGARYMTEDVWFAEAPARKGK